MAGKIGMKTSKTLDLPRQYGRTGVVAKLDPRSGVAKALRMRVELLKSDLGGDLSRQQQLLVERVAWLELHLARMEIEIVDGKRALSATEYTAMVNALTGLLRTLGVKRVARDVPRLYDMLRDAAAAEASPT